MNVLLVVLGVALLYLGGEVLVRSASGLASRLGVRPMVIGLTVVAFGTSAPELAASLTAAISGTPEIAVANVVGSNIANVGLILGLTALLYPLVTSSRFVRREVPLMLLVTAALAPVLWGGRVSRWEGVVLLALLGGFLWLISRGGSTLLDEVESAEQLARTPAWLGLLGTVAGLVLLWGGAQALVGGAVALATAVGVSQRVIGLTVVAIGTSLPELASSMVAALRREADLILGNIVGSNVFNLLAVLGATSVVRPIRFDGRAVTPDIVVMAAFSLALLPLMWRGQRLGRAGGAVLLIGYLAYVLALVR
ncbi:MAG: calcium/sodium antiporter [Deinococcales bacterium]|jgi:cation:H+ antiporter